ncbi:hypothetical protein [Salinicoccus kekensis]|uniref:Uncharacterized protein n=1 Tax=Salinicoccus kekensis TaxID=714307 RepID=A0A285UQQ8_9STAP|nr:hypothetical protein [Salinicoccus kekensis]SOC44103.1 hypothetical protein SAMN05878391_2205 [Salinicoccus kekensis]
MMDFLYFPDDPMEYIPAAFAMLVCFLVAYAAYRIIKSYSKNQEEKMKNFEEEVMRKLEQKEADESGR